MKRKRLLMMLGSVCLALMLALPLVASCGPATPEEATEEIAALESKLSAEKAKSAGLEDDVSDLEAEITALKAPGEVLEWFPATYASAGMIWDCLVHIADVITRNSDGRIVATATVPGAVCPVEEQLDAVAMGVTPAMFWYPGYFSGKIPITAVSADIFYAPVNKAEAKYLYEDYEGGQIIELIRDTYADYGDIYLVGYSYVAVDGPLCSNVPIYSITDLDGVPWRSSEVRAEVLAHFGAATIWCPGDEIYTLLATGVVDGCNYGGVPTMIGMGFHEVTKYWTKKPLTGETCAIPFCVSGTVWNGLPDDLKSIVQTAIRSSTVLGALDGQLAMAEAWRQAEEYGMEIIEWSDEDCAKWYEGFRLKTQAYRTDPAVDELYILLEPVLQEWGYWE